MDLMDKIREDLCDEANQIERNRNLLMGTEPSDFLFTKKDFKYYDLCKAPNREKLNPEFFTHFYNHETGKLKDYDSDYLSYLNNFQNKSEICWQRYTLLEDDNEGSWIPQPIPYANMILMVAYWGTLYSKEFDSLSDWFSYYKKYMILEDVEGFQVLVNKLDKKLKEVEGQK